MTRRPFLRPDSARALLRVLDADTSDFPALLATAGLDPRKDLKSADLRGVRFHGAALTNYDFTSADLRDTDLAASPGGYIIGPTTRLPDGFPGRPPPDFDANEARQMILDGRAPPLSWRPFIVEVNLRNEKNFSRLAPLAGLFNLQTLNLWNTQVSDLKPIDKLVKLRDLDLYNTKVSDTSMLDHINGLKIHHTTGTERAFSAVRTIGRRLKRAFDL